MKSIRVSPPSLLLLLFFLTLGFVQVRSDTEAESNEEIQLCTAETVASGECQGIVPTLDDIRALQTELRRLKAENTQLKGTLTSAKISAIKKESIKHADNQYPYPPGECMHPPHFRFLNEKGVVAGPLPANRSMDRLLTDPHGLTLNLEFVTRGGEVPRGYIGDLPGVEELTELPSPADFLAKYVLKSRPFVVRNATASWAAYKLWTDEYLMNKIGRATVSVRKDRHRDKVFHYNREAQMSKMSFKEFIEATQTPEERAAYAAKQAALDAEYEKKTRLKAIPKKFADLETERLYLAQAAMMWKGVKSQLYALCDDLEGRCPSPDFAKGLDVKHMNMWFGKGNKTVILHYDNNEGIMAMMSGYKTFTLYSPSNRNYLYPMVANEYSAVSSLVPDAQIAGTEKLDEQAFPCFKYAKGTSVTLGPGDLFYLPAYWYHRVHSYGRSLGINWWFASGSVLLQQMMKTIDLNVDVTERDGTVRPQRRW